MFPLTYHHLHGGLYRCHHILCEFHVQKVWIPLLQPFDDSHTERCDPIAATTIIRYLRSTAAIVFIRSVMLLKYQILPLPAFNETTNPTSATIIVSGFTHVEI